LGDPYWLLVKGVDRSGYSWLRWVPRLEVGKLLAE